MQKVWRRSLSIKGGEAVIYQGKAKKNSIYINSKPYKTAAEIKAITGCDLIINGTWYNNSPVKPVGNFKVDGVVLSKEYDQCLGYGWKNGEQPRMVWSDMSDVDNFICATPLIHNGAKVKLNYPAEVGGSRGRTALGQKADGEWVFLCTSDASGAMTPEQLQDKLLDLGCVSGMMMDGGGSSQMIYPSGVVSTSRTIYNYICVWLDGAGKATQPEKETQTGYKKGIDVSEHQGVVDWGKAENEIDFAMIRAGYGQNNIDKQFVRNISECNRIGIPCGVYWFSYALTPEMARQEALYCLEAVKPYKLDMPIAFDFEYDSVSYALQKGVKVDKELATAICHAFCETIEAAGYYVTNYTNVDFLSNYFDETTTAKHDLWLASWSVTPYLIKPPRVCGMWQYSDKGKVSGITGNVDMNVAYKDYPAIIKAAGLNTPKPATTNIDAATAALQLIAAGRGSEIIKLL